MAPKADADFVLSVHCGSGIKGKGVTEGGLRNLKQPRGMCLDKDGSLFVADYGNSCVYRFWGKLKNGKAPRSKVVAGDEGNMLGDYDPLKDIESQGPIPAPDGEGRLLKRPVDVKIAHEGNGIYVLDFEANQVQHYLPGDAYAKMVVGEKRASVNTPDGLKYPRVIQPCEDGTIAMSDTFSHRVLRCRVQGPGEVVGKPNVLVGTSNSTHEKPEYLSFPTGFVFLEDGSLVVADTNYHRIQKFPPGFEEGAAGVTIFGSKDCKPGSSLSELNMPTVLALDPTDGSLLVTDRDNARVLRFSANSKAGDAGELVIASDHLSKPWGLCVDDKGAVFVSDERKAQVLRFGPPLEQTISECVEEEEAVIAEVADVKKTASSQTATSTREPTPEPALEKQAANLAPTVSGSAMDLD